MALTAETILERNHLFRGLPASTIRQLAAVALRRTYPSGALVFSQADPGDALFGVVTGKIRISASSPEGREMFLNIMEPGDTFGEIALLDGQPRTATATTTAPSELTVITRKDFFTVLHRETMLVDHLLQLLCRRIRWASGLAEESALLAVPARLAGRLLSLGKIHGRRAPRGLQLTISQEEIARFLGLSRQVVNQHLQSWKAQGWVDLGRGKVILLDEAALRRVLAGSDPPVN